MPAAAPAAPWSKSTTSSCAPTAASSRSRCRATASPRSTSRATSTSPPKAAASRSALRQALIDFDRDGRLSVAGLPTCAPEAIADASTEEARRICAGAIVGTGQVEALIALASGDVPARSPLTIFNGPRARRAADRGPARPHHRARPPRPTRSSSRSNGAAAASATGRALDLPPIAAGLGALTHVDVEIGRRYRAGGKQRSYVSARCCDGILQTHGRFSFEDGTIVDGRVEKFCRAK